MSLCAQSLDMTKPNVSKTIAGLENELGVQLFFRSRSGSHLTPAGEQVYEHAQIIWENYEALADNKKKDSAQTNTLRMLYQDAQGSFIQQFVNILTDKYALNGILVSSAPVPHLCEPETVRNSDVIGGTILREDLDFLKPYRDEYLIYDINESPLAFVIETKQLTSKEKSVKSITDLKRYRYIEPANTPVGDEKPTCLLDRYFERHNLASKLNITYCNSFSMYWHFLFQGYASILDEYDIEHEGGEPVASGKFSVLKIKPEEIALHYLMIKRDSPFFTDLSEAMATLFNKSQDEFPNVVRIN